MEEAAVIAGGVPTGANFTLTEGDFLWVRFPANQVVDLGFELAETVDIPAGISAFSYARFPAGYTGHALAASLGLANVRALRVLDAATGRWNLLEVDAGAVIGLDFALPQAAVVIADMVQPVASWKP